jgi:hypothetical protein
MLAQSQIQSLQLDSLRFLTMSVTKVLVMDVTATSVTSETYFRDTNMNVSLLLTKSNHMTVQFSSASSWQGVERSPLAMTNFLQH